MGYSVLIHWLLSLSSCQSSVDMRYLKDGAQELSIRGRGGGCSRTHSLVIVSEQGVQGLSIISL